MSSDDLASRLTPQVYDHVMRAISEGVYDWDIAQGKVYYSERVRRVLSWAVLDERNLNSWRELIHPQDLPRYDSGLTAHFKRRTDRFECEYRYRALDGSWRWARQHGVALHDESGRACRMIGSTGDITDLKRTEEALRKSDERFALAIQAATEGIYELDLEAGTTEVSDRARVVFEWPGDRFSAALWKERIHPDDAGRYRQALIAYFRRAVSSFECEYRLRVSAGYKWLLDRAVGVRNESGRVTRLVGAVSDITQRKEHEIELRRARDHAEAATRAKSDFLSNMSHELRTPLNSIIGFAEVLGERIFGELNDKQDEYLKDIHSSGLHLLSLINDMLDLAKIEAGRMELDVSEFDVRTTLAHALSLVRERAQRHGIALQLDADAKLGTFRADERKLKQILLNLLSNAVKFTPDGGHIRVTARRTEGSIEVTVRDTGVGISAEDREAVFEEFRQVGGDAARKQEGTGLGLALTRRFVELHGGKIHVESEPGMGSTFTFTLASQA